MKLALVRFWTKLMYMFEPFACAKEAGGYRCRHEMHGNVLECGKWSTVRTQKGELL